MLCVEWDILTKLLTYLLTYLLYPNKSTNPLKFVPDIHPGNKHDRLDLTQCAEWPQLAFQFENLTQDKEISDLQNFRPTSSCLKRTGASSLYRSSICHFNFLSMALWLKRVSHVALRTDIIFEFEVSQPIHACLITVLSYWWYLTLYAVILTFDPLTLNVCALSAVTWSNSAPNLSEIEQSAAEL